MDKLPIQSSIEPRNGFWNSIQGMNINFLSDHRVNSISFPQPYFQENVTQAETISKEKWFKTLKTWGIEEEFYPQIMYIEWIFILAT